MNNYINQLRKARKWVYVVVVRFCDLDHFKATFKVRLLGRI